LVLSFPPFQARTEQFAWRPTVLTLKLNLNPFARFFKKRSHPRCSILLHAWKAQIGTELAGKNFMLGRFRAWYQEEGHAVDTIQAVLARRPTKPADFDARVKAVSHFRTLDEAATLAAANKRVSNILAKSTDTLLDHVHASVLKEAAELKLATHLVVLRDKLEPLFAAGQYQEALVELAALRETVDSFFDTVMVMDENEAIRVNRLTLLSKLRELFLQVADISLLQ